MRIQKPKKTTPPSSAFDDTVRITPKNIQDTNETLQVANADLSQSQFTDVNLHAACFTNVNLSESTFADINLSGSKFSDVNLTNVEIDHCDVTGMKIQGVLVSDLLKSYERRN